MPAARYWTLFLIGFLCYWSVECKLNKLEQDDEKALLVTTKSGDIKGKVINSSAGKVYAFLGIPYAKPPLGKLRYKRPQPVEPWTGLKNLTEFGPSCIQQYHPIARHIEGLKDINYMGPQSEDCLLLNVMVPGLNRKDNDVVVYLHPGGFTELTASAEMFQAEEFTAHGGIITVTINYRLGSFGLLYLDHPEVEGNVALLDQVMALEWVRDNIAAFGGDPKKVTLFGLSAGAISTTLHMVSPLSKGLFRRAIAESGSALFDLAVVSKQKVINVTLELAENVGCPNRHNVSEVYKCLLEADVDLLRDSQPVDENSHIVYFPIVDGRFLTKDPEESYQQGEFHEVDLLTGFNSDEGTLFILLYVPLVFNPTRDDVYPHYEDKKYILRQVKKNATDKEINDLLMFYSKKNLTELTKSKEYKDISDAASDYVFNCGITKTLAHVSNSSKNVFAYYFTHRSTASKAGKWLGVFHAASAYYSLGNVLKPRFAHYNEEDKELSRRFISYYSNFIRTGDPNLSPEPKGKEWITWPPFTPEKHRFLVLAPRNSTIIRNPREDYCPLINGFHKTPRD